jgi:hypothetical protein
MTSTDSGSADGPSADSGSTEASLTDASSTDASLTDATVADANLTDANLTGCPPIAGPPFYVDATRASSGNGSQACPFKTITQALAAVTGLSSPPALATINVAPGTYDAALGETFPLVIAANVQLTGDTTMSSRDLFIVDGHGQAFTPLGNQLVTVVLQGEIDYMELTDSSGQADEIVVATTGKPHLSLTSVVGIPSSAVTETGIALLGQPSAAQGGTLTIDNQSEVQSMTGDGIRVDPDTAGLAPTLISQGTIIHANLGDGVHVIGRAGANPVVQLGGGAGICAALSNPDANWIFCNQGFGVEAGTLIVADGNKWDHAPLKTGTAPTDVNNTSLVADACPTVAPGACP